MYVSKCNKGIIHNTTRQCSQWHHSDITVYIPNMVYTINMYVDNHIQYIPGTLPITEVIVPTDMSRI